jgi:hypothetical protein
MKGPEAMTNVQIGQMVCDVVSGGRRGVLCGTHSGFT